MSRVESCQGTRQINLWNDSAKKDALWVAVRIKVSPQLNEANEIKVYNLTTAMRMMLMTMSTMWNALKVHPIPSTRSTHSPPPFEENPYAEKERQKPKREEMQHSFSRHFPLNPPLFPWLFAIILSVSFSPPCAKYLPAISLFFSGLCRQTGFPSWYPSLCHIVIKQ